MSYLKSLFTAIFIASAIVIVGCAPRPNADIAAPVEPRIQDQSQLVKAPSETGAEQQTPQDEYKISEDGRLRLKEETEISKSKADSQRR